MAPIEKAPAGTRGLLEAELFVAVWLNCDPDLSPGPCPHFGLIVRYAYYDFIQFAIQGLANQI